MLFKEWLEKEKQRKDIETQKLELEQLRELKEKYELGENRFVDNDNGTITDNITKLIWLKNANAFGSRTWEQAVPDVNDLSSGSAGLTDGSESGDWRLPSTTEFQSLIDRRYSYPTLSGAAGTSKWTEGNAFVGVKLKEYWSGTAYFDNMAKAWLLDMSYGYVRCGNKTDTYYVWPVREDKAYES